ncbi:MAG: RNA polymerase sigma factor [Spirochaetes bacterium]|nr:RNA polymerase sigma factor [Spirochaetota bacterium]
MDDITLFSDEELVSLFKGGNERAFEVLYDRYSVRLKKLIYRNVSNEEAVHDILQDTFMRVLRHIGTFDVTMSFTSWIYQIAVNCCKNYYNRYSKDRTIIEKESYRIAENERCPVSPDDELIQDDDRRSFNEAVMSLKEKFREVFLLRYDHNMKYQDISKTLGISERTAKWRMRVAVERIAMDLKKKGVI